jgi:hypothetical protein
MASFPLDIAAFKKFVLLNINNRLGHDVRDKVLPVRILSFGAWLPIASGDGFLLRRGEGECSRKVRRGFREECARSGEGGRRGGNIDRRPALHGVMHGRGE